MIRHIFKKPFKIIIIMSHTCVIIPSEDHSELGRILKAPAILANYNANWASKWLPRLVSLAKASRVPAVCKTATEMNHDSLPG